MAKFVLLFVIGGIFCFFSINPSTGDNTSGSQEFDKNACNIHTTVDLTNLEKASSLYYDSIFSNNKSFEAEGFDFPVGKPDATNYFNAQLFGEEHHLGEDWNGKGGGNTDLGDPIYTTADGLVTFTEDVCCGWGNIVRIVHKLPNHPNYNYIESLYAHMHNINVKTGDLIKRGQQIGTIGTAHGRYSAHLHFEMRDLINLPIGQGYSEDQRGYFSPTEFIDKNRPSE